MRVIRPGQDLLFIVELGHADNGTKHFTLDNRIFLFRPGQQRWLEEIPPPLDFIAARHHVDMAERFRVVNGFTDALKMRR
ncbi:hypothetical protein D3C72_1255990 [compost metagenome]